MRLCRFETSPHVLVINHPPHILDLMEEVPAPESYLHIMDIPAVFKPFVVDEVPARIGAALAVPDSPLR